MFGRGGRKNRARIEPRLDWPARARRAIDQLRADPADRPATARRDEVRQAAIAQQEGRRRRPRSAPCFGRLALLDGGHGRLGRASRSAASSPTTPASLPPDRPARGAEAPAQHRHPRRGRHADRQSRRHRRRRPCGSSTCRPTCPRRSSPSRTGASIRISASTRSASIARGASRHRPGAARGGRLDPDPAARQEPVPDPGADAVAQDPGGDPRTVARAQIFQGPDPRALSQSRLFRLRRLRGRGGGAEIFRQERAIRDSCRRRPSSPG